jgi:hypothetical protein
MEMNLGFNRLVFVLAICLVCASTAMAATTCPSTTYADYNPNPPGPGSSITCVTENLQFSQFGFTSSAQGGALTPTPASIGVTVLDPGADGPGFDFNPGFSVGPGQKQDAVIKFEVTGLNGTLINDLFIGFNGSFSGTGSTTYSETYCTTGFGTGTCGNFQVNNPPTALNQTITFAGVSHLYITKDFAASGGTNGSASISDVVNEFSSPVPEPRQVGLMVLGMIGLVFAHRRFKTSVS